MFGDKDPMSKSMTKSWKEIHDYYRGFVDGGLSFECMFNLIGEIGASSYSRGLFAWTSMHDLCVVQTPVTYPYDGPYLRISPLPNGQLEFRYVDTCIKEKQWHRIVNGAEAFARLERFIKQLHWFA